jgi:FKBP-type peptidyl-prolyl cis-trans isomerase SlyD
MKQKESNKELQVVYTLIGVQTGKKIEIIPDDQPVTLILGNNQLLPDFEKSLIHLNTGDTFDIIVKSENAYGPSDPYAIFDVPQDTFSIDGKIDPQMLQKGNVIPMTDVDGNKHHGEIIAISDEYVTMDFNHPLAGQDLRFIGKIISINT